VFVIAEVAISQFVQSDGTAPRYDAQPFRCHVSAYEMAAIATTGLRPNAVRLPPTELAARRFQI